MKFAGHYPDSVLAGKSRVLFVGEAVSLAHVARPAVLARWAREAGHEVCFACGGRYAGVARGEGLEPIAIETVDAADFYARLAKGRFFYATEELQRYVRAEIELIDRVKPDLVVGDFRLTLPISAELCGVKCLSLANAHWSPAAERNLPAPENGLFGLLPRYLREKLFDVVRPLAYRYFAAPLDRVRRSFGLPAFEDFREHYTAGDYCAYLDLPELSPAFGHRLSAVGITVAPKAESPSTMLRAVSLSNGRKSKADLPPGHFFLGPVSWSPRGAPEPLLGALGLERPLAYVSMGSSGDGRRLPEVLRALLAEGCDVAVSGVKPVEEAALRRAVPELDGRSFIGEFFNPGAVLDGAALTVCHGGSGTVYQSLEYGVPALCFPSNPDQKLVSEAVEKAGAGRTALTPGPSPLGRGEGSASPCVAKLGFAEQGVRAQVAELLAGRCRVGARRLAEAMRDHDTRGKWIEFLDGRKTVNRNTLTQRLHVLEELSTSTPAAPERFSFAGGRYTIRVANDLESRKKAYRLVYDLYREKEYAQPHPSRMWLSIFDALPETATLLVERQADGCGLKAEGKTEASSSPSAFGLQPSALSVPVGALTVVFDSPMGLPADKLCGPELDALRSSGRRLSEVVSLGVAEEAGAGSEILVKLFNYVYLLSRKVRGATDFMITVNPRHVRFYERTLLFEEAGPEREYDKVGGAPALLLRLDLEVPEERVRLEHGPAETRPPKSRTLYPMFVPPAEEPDLVAGLAAQLRPMTQHELGYFFVTETGILAGATPEQREFIHEQCLSYELA